MAGMAGLAALLQISEEKITIVLMQQRKDSGTIPLTRRLRNVALADLLG